MDKMNDRRGLACVTWGDRSRAALAAFANPPRGTAPAVSDRTFEMFESYRWHRAPGERAESVRTLRASYAAHAGRRPSAERARLAADTFGLHSCGLDPFRHNEIRARALDCDRRAQHFDEAAINLAAAWNLACGDPGLAGYNRAAAACDARSFRIRRATRSDVPFDHLTRRAVARLDYRAGIGAPPVRIAGQTARELFGAVR